MAKRSRARNTRKASGRQVMNEMSAPRTPPTNAAIVEASHRKEAVKLWYDAVDPWEADDVWAKVYG